MVEDSNSPSLGESSNNSVRRDSIGDSVQRRRYIRRPKPDIHAPKRPLSAYINFSKDQRNEYEHNNWSFSTLAKHIGEDWRDLNQAVKNRYLEEAAEEKLNYDQAMQRYKTTAAYNNYKRYVQDFNRRHNSKQFTERSSSPDQSPVLSLGQDEDVTLDGEVGARDDLKIDLAHMPTLSDEATEQGHKETPLNAQPPGTINPVNLSGTTPSPTDMDFFSRLPHDQTYLSQPTPHYAIPSIYAAHMGTFGYHGTLGFGAEHFGASGLDMAMLQSEEIPNMPASQLDGFSFYHNGHDAMSNGNLMTLPPDTAIDEESLRQELMSGWSGHIMSTAQ